MRVMVLGASGMLGNAMLRVMWEKGDHEVWGGARSANVKRYFPEAISKRIFTGVDVENFDALAKLFVQVRPEVVINCIGLVKQLSEADDPLQALPINSLFPHRLACLCELIGARLVHFSTDCVFNGHKGNYQESDNLDALDLYGRTKFLGEVTYKHTITLRTSIIGHELATSHSLIGWFLSQQESVKGYRRAIFSGLPTVELSRLVRDVVLSRPDLFGLFHVASAPITKYDLLKLVAQAYGKDIIITPDDTVVSDHSLNADRFIAATDYRAPAWPELVRRMREFDKENSNCL